MKNIVKIALLALLVAFTYSCKDDDNLGAGDIEILFVYPTLDIDLNVSDNPSVISVINSKNPLRSVSMYILKGDAEEAYRSPVTLFTNKNSYSIREMPVYREDMTGLKIIVEDVSGYKTEGTVAFVVKPVLNAPAITFTPSSVTVTEGDVIPAITATVVSSSDLKYVRLTRVVNRVELEYVDTITVFNQPKEFLFDINDYSGETIFEPGITSLKIEAVDVYDKRKIELLPVEFVELPAPVVTFADEETIDADEFSSVTVAGNVTANSDIKSIVYYLVGENPVAPLKIAEETSFPSNAKKHDFSQIINSISAIYNGFQVEVTDVLGKKTVETKTINVVAYPSPEIALPVADYYGIASGTTINLAGNVITSSPANITNVKIETENLSGDLTLVADLITDAASYTPSNTISAVADLAKIIITATNAKGKTKTVEIPVTVDFYLLKNLVMGPQFTNGTNTASTYDTPCFFSSVSKKMMTLQEGFNNPSVVDWGISIATGGSLKVCQIGNSEVQSRFKHTTYGLTNWTVQNATKVKSNALGLDDLSKFFSYSATDIKNISSSSINGTAEKLWDVTGQVVVFETVTRNGKIQRGIILLEGLDTSSAYPTLGATNNRATFNVTVKLTTPY